MKGGTIPPFVFLGHFLNLFSNNTEITNFLLKAFFRIFTTQSLNS